MPEPHTALNSCVGSDRIGSDQIRLYHIFFSHTRLTRSFDLNHGFILQAHVDMLIIMLKPCMDFTADHGSIRITQSMNICGSFRVLGCWRILDNAVQIMAA